MRIIFIRHGKTKGNEEHRYIGVTDEPLSLNGVSEIKANAYPDADRVITTPLKRCIETANIIYNIRPEIYEDLREYDFGEFENKAFDDLKDNSAYMEWVNSGGNLPFPVGEGQLGFSKRCCSCFENIIKNNKAESIAFVVHGGTIMAILENFACEKRSFFDWQIKNGKGYIFELKDIKSLKLQLISEI